MWVAKILFSIVVRNNGDEVEKLDLQTIGQAAKHRQATLQLELLNPYHRLCLGYSLSGS